MPTDQPDGLTRYECPHCGKRVKAGDDAAGKTVTCPKCGERFSIPVVEEYDEPRVYAAPEGEASYDDEPIVRHRRRRSPPWAVLAIVGLVLATVVGMFAVVAKYGREQ